MVRCSSACFAVSFAICLLLFFFLLCSFWWWQLVDSGLALQWRRVDHILYVALEPYRLGFCHGPGCIGHGFQCSPSACRSTAPIPYLEASVDTLVLSVGLKNLGTGAVFSVFLNVCHTCSLTVLWTLFVVTYAGCFWTLVRNTFTSEVDHHYDV